jgi:uncharacterized protein
MCVPKMRLNLDDLCLRGGQRHVCTYTIDIAPVLLGGVKYEAVVPEGVTVCVERVAGGYLVRLGFAAKVFGLCYRCLNETAVEVLAEEEEFLPTPAGGWVDSEANAFVDGLMVDVSGLSREALVLAMPDRVLCSVDCKGLCAQCGADLNAVECGCEPLEISGLMG